tara:strand:- start:2481 stop:2954 length:474 start_codon:yes stop_codon:yes gene_type:complete
MIHTNEINPNTGKKYWYKDNPETKREYNKTQMFVDGKYISRSHPLYKAGKFKTFGDAAFSSLVNYEDSTEGEVYVITNPAFVGWVKIGMAIDSEDRLKGYQTSSPHRDYKLEYSKPFTDRRKAEAEAHTISKQSHVKAGEWFQMTIQEATSVIEGIK